MRAWGRFIFDEMPKADMPLSYQQPEAVTICECAVRDGLQHERAFIPTETKLAMIRRFVSQGFKRIEVTSFSHPVRVPQFADAENLLRNLERVDGVSYKATCVNATAVRRAIAAAEAGFGPSEISLVVSASESHSLRNVGARHDEVEREFSGVIGDALDQGLAVMGTIATAFGCPFTGTVAPSDVVRWVEFFTAHGIHTISLGDTTGMANPRGVRERFDELMGAYRGVSWVAHLHDSRGLALANAVAALEAGVRSFDAAFGGLGGHPANIRYARGHTGNLVTEDFVAALESMGIATGLRIDKLADTARWVEKVIGRPLHGHIGRAGLASDLLDESSA